MKYYINGWTELKTYFFYIGRFTETEFEKLMNGETITKYGNMFWIDKED